MGASKSRDIRDALVTRLATVQKDGAVAFTEVVGFEGNAFDGYPSVRVLPLDLNNEKGSSYEMDRTVGFIVRTHVPAVQDGSDYAAMYELTDLIVDSLDEADVDNTFQAAIGTYILSTTRGSWTYEDSGTGVVLCADINVEVSYSKDL